MDAQQRLRDAGFELPSLEEPAFDYEPYAIQDGVVWLAGQLAKEGGIVKNPGRAGAELGDDEVARQASGCALQALARLEQAAGSLSKVRRIIQINVWVACALDYERISWVADHASNIFVTALGERGRHPRSVLGIARLPQNAPVMIDLRAAIEAG